ncbi:MAG: hypothetical protein F6K14_09270 [Symploca sp. SIO2C1]|nr:hypothetical protein [Symploca sp. SIO2C1]
MKDLSRLESLCYCFNKSSFTLTAAAESVTINEALALQSVGGGIFIGTDHNVFANTANQVLTNFGFDSLFSGIFNITDDGSFVGDLLLEPESVGGDFFTNNLEGVSTSQVPVGEHTLNANGANRNIEIFENLFSLSPGKVSHIGASFETGSGTTPIEPKSVPEPATGIGILCLSILMWFRKITSA